MATTLAFDVYGTLIDTQGVTKTLTKWIGDRAEMFSETWRNKQLEYSFRRGLMQSYQPFSSVRSKLYNIPVSIMGLSYRQNKSNVAC